MGNLLGYIQLLGVRVPLPVHVKIIVVFGFEHNNYNQGDLIMYYVYKTTNVVNNKIYVGVHKSDSI
jgi:hypothetical protein